MILYYIFCIIPLIKLSHTDITKMEEQELMKYITNISAQTGKTASIRVFLTPEKTILINNLIIKKLTKYNLFFEGKDNTQIIELITSIIILKQQDSISKFKFKTETTFILNFVPKLYYALKQIPNMDFTTMANFFNKASLEDVKRFVKTPDNNTHNFFNT